MPPAFNLSQDQTLQFNLETRIPADTVWVVEDPNRLDGASKYFETSSAKAEVAPDLVAHTYRL